MDTYQWSKFKEHAFKVWVYISVTVIVLVCLYPFLNVLAYSLSSNLAILSGNVTFYPIDIRFDAYKRMLSTNWLLRSLRISVTVTLVGTIVSLSATTLAAYALSKKRLKGRAVLTVFIIFPLYFTGGIIPTFMVVKGLGLVDNLAALILPIAVSSFNFIIMKTFFQQMPESLEDAAMIDGCNDLTYLLKIVLPLSGPILATIGLFYAVQYWNDYFNGLLYITSPAKYPLQLLLRQLLFTEALNQISLSENIGQQVLPEAMKAAAVVVAIVPIVMIYPFLQKHFVKGIMLGSVKG
jgi:ABC-type glycerol-3-phosphate transport system permease component